MGISIGVVLLVLFLVFMLTADGVSDEAKTISLAIGIVAGAILLIKVIWG